MSHLKVRRIVIPPGHNDLPEPAWEDLAPLGAEPDPALTCREISRWIRIEKISQKIAEQVALCYRGRGGVAAWFVDPLLAGKPKQEGVAILEENSIRLEELLQQGRLSEEAPLVQEVLGQWNQKSQQVPSSWQFRGRTLTFGEERPYVMGILNVTPDSFSDGGLFLEPSRAVERGLQMIEEGADIIDIGGESTRPGAAFVEADEEKRRILPVIKGLATQSTVPLSVDTTKAEVAEAALDAGAEIINDISGLRFDARLAEVVACRGAYLILMHSRETPATMQQRPAYSSLWGELLQEMDHQLRQAQEAGISAERIAVDPGIGFGKRLQDNYRIIRELPVLRGYGLPVLIGASRKSFLGAVLGTETEDRLEGSLAVAAVAAFEAAADIIRVHEPAPTVKLLNVVEALRRPPSLCKT